MADGIVAKNYEFCSLNSPANQSRVEHNYTSSQHRCLCPHLQTWRSLPGTQERFCWKLLFLSSSKRCHQGASQKTSLQRTSRSKPKRFMPLSRSYSYTAAAAMPTLLSGRWLSLVPNLSMDANSPTSLGSLLRKSYAGGKIMLVMSKCMNVHTFQMRLLQIHWSGSSSRVSFRKSMTSPRWKMA